MKKKFLLALILSSVHLFAQSISPQYDTILRNIKTDSTTVYKLYFIDGSEINCRITSFDSIKVSFKSLSGIVGEVKISSLEKIVVLKGKWEKENFIKANPHSSHLLLSPTAKNLQAGSVYYGNAELFFWMLSVAPTDFLTVGIGLPVVPNIDFETIYGYVKLNLGEYAGFNFAAGVVGTVANSNYNYAPFEVITYQHDLFSVTAGFYNNLNHTSMPYFGGELKLSKRVSLVTENWIIPDSKYNLYSFAIRFSGQSFGSDIGFFNAWDGMDRFPFMPWLGFFIVF